MTSHADLSAVPYGGRAALLDRALADLLEQAPELQAAAVVSFDGLAMASALPAGMDEDRVAAMSAALLSLGERAAEGLGRGELSQIYVEGENGTVFLVSAQDEAVLVAVAARRAKVGLMLFEVRRAAHAVGAVLQGESAPAPEPLLPPTLVPLPTPPAQADLPAADGAETTSESPADPAPHDPDVPAADLTDWSTDEPLDREDLPPDPADDYVAEPEERPAYEELFADPDEPTQPVGAALVDEPVEAVAPVGQEDRVQDGGPAPTGSPWSADALPEPPAVYGGSWPQAPSQTLEPAPTEAAADEPVAVAPVSSEPDLAEVAPAEPAAYQPAEHEAVEHEAVEHEAVEHQPAASEPAEPEATGPQASEYEPAEPAAAEHGPAEHDVAEPVPYQPAAYQPAEHEPAPFQPYQPAARPPAANLPVAAPAATWYDPSPKVAYSPPAVTRGVWAPYHGPGSS